MDNAGNIQNSRQLALSILPGTVDIILVHHDMHRTIGVSHYLSSIIFLMLLSILARHLSVSVGTTTVMSVDFLGGDGRD